MQKHLVNIQMHGDKNRKKLYNLFNGLVLAQIETTQKGNYPFYISRDITREISNAH